MTPPVPGLRLLYNSKSAGKVSLSVQPGEDLTVSEDIAAQLQAADGHFVAYDAEKAAVFPLVDDVAAADESGGDTQPEPEATPAPVKKAATKKAAAAKKA